MAMQITEMVGPMTEGGWWWWNTDQKSGFKITGQYHLPGIVV